MYCIILLGKRSSCIIIMVFDIHFSILILEYTINFQMKQGKAKKIQPKKVNLIQSQTVPSYNIDQTNKQPSGHTKMSTNYTIHSAAQNISNAKKNKKNNTRNSKENLLKCTQRLPTFKSVKRFKINLQDQSGPIDKPEQSYREYCLIDENFVPIETFNDKQKLQDIFSHTASTDFTYQKRTPATPTYHLRQRIISKIKELKAEQMPAPFVEKVDISTSIHSIKKILVQEEVNAVVQYKEIGLQYSERFQAKQVKQQQNIQQQKNEEQTLSELLFKLQFSHLANEKSFSKLTSNEKQHFSQLLQTLVSKLKPKPINIKPIDFSNDQADEGEDLQYKHPFQQQSKHLQVLQSSEQLQKLICLREYRQMNWIQYSTQNQSQDQVNTSLFSVINFLCHLFCYIEVQYSEELVYMIQKVYGPTFREKYRRITRGIPLIPDRKFRVIDDSIFLDFINQSNSFSNSNEIVHFKAIFDSFNEHLQEYRPFYLGNGQQFPWAFKMLISMSEYAINEDSLQIIFLQTKQKMIEWCSNLCGLIVDCPDKKLLGGNPLQTKRNEKEQKLIRSWLKEQNFQKDGIELYSTQVLHDMSQTIYQQLVKEFTQQFFSF